MYFSFTENTRRTLQREDLLLIIERLETSSGVLRAVLEDVDYSESPTPLSGSQTRLHEGTTWYSNIRRSCCNRPALYKILHWILRYHFIITVVIQVSFYLLLGSSIESTPAQLLLLVKI